MKALKYKPQIEKPHISEETPATIRPSCDHHAARDGRHRHNKNVNITMFLF